MHYDLFLVSLFESIIHKHYAILNSAKPTANRIKYSEINKEKKMSSNAIYNLIFNRPGNQFFHYSMKSTLISGNGFIFLEIFIMDLLRENKFERTFDRKNNNYHQQSLFAFQLLNSFSICIFSNIKK